MSVSVDIVSVGTLSRNRFWNETGTVRPSHATTTLLRDGEATVIVDPSLPGEILEQRLDERSGLKPERIDTVLLTNFRPVHRRGLALFSHATWLMSADEIEALTSHLHGIVDAAGARGEEVDELVEQEIKLLSRIQPAPQRLTDQMHLFPSAGVTPGAASLLALSTERTIAVTGDAIINRDYFAHRQAFEQHSNAEQAVQAVGELIEIADIIIPGHGDWILNM